MLPCGTIIRLFPLRLNSFAIVTKGAGETLRETGEISPDLPRVVAKTHLIDPGNTARIIVKYAVRLRCVIGTNDPYAMRNIGTNHFFMLDDEPSAFQPLKPDTPIYYSRRIRMK